MATAEEFLARANSKKSKASKKVDRSKMATRPWNLVDQEKSEKKKAKTVVKKSKSQRNVKREENKTLKKNSEKKTADTENNLVEVKASGSKNGNAIAEKPVKKEATSPIIKEEIIIESRDNHELQDEKSKNSKSVDATKVESRPLVIQGASAGAERASEFSNASPYEKVLHILAERELSARQMKIITGIAISQKGRAELVPISNNDWMKLLNSEHVKWVQTEIKKLIKLEIIVKVNGQSGVSKSSYGLNL